MIDAHVHIWDSMRFPVGWIGAASQLPPVRTIDDLMGEAGTAAPDHLVIIQAGTDSDGTRWLLQTHRRDPRVVAIVATCRLGMGESWHDLRRRVNEAQAADASRRLRGIRINGRRQGRDFFAGRIVREAFAVLGDTGLRAHILADHEQLEGLARLAAEIPNVPIMLDHLGSPPWRGPLAGWIHGLVAIAEVPGTMAKVSGAELITAKTSVARAVVETAANCFGPERLAFGSDWPMSTREHGYIDVVRRVRKLLADTVIEPGSPGLWTDNAANFYRP